MLRNLPTSEERRNLTLDDASVDLTDPTGEAAIGGTFVGYSSVFGKRAAIGNPAKGGFLEEISPGAYTKTIVEADQRFLLDHNPLYVVARRSAGSLHQTQDTFGLMVRANLDYNLSYVNDLAANVRNGNLTGMSVGFRVPEGKDEWTNTMLDTRSGKLEVELRTIKEIALIENSAVTFPAYTDTTASLRHSLVPALLQRRDSEAIRRAATYRPDLAQWLGFDSELSPVYIDLATRGRERIRPGSDAAEAARQGNELRDETQDISDAQAAIAILAKLIMSEASEMPMNPAEDYDIQLLLEAVAALRYFIQREQDEQTGDDTADVGDDTVDVPLMLKSKHFADELRAILKARQGNELPGEVLGHDQTIHADGEVMDPSEERDPKAPYGNVTYADPGYQKDGKKRYPLDTKDHAKAAWGYINQADNAKAYSAEQLKSIKTKIRSACKKFGVEIDDRGDEPAETTRTDPNEQETAGDSTEPAASTRFAPSQHELAKARLRALHARMSGLAA